MTETLSEDIINEIRISYEIPEDYKPYFPNFSVFNKFSKKSKSIYEEFWTDDDELSFETKKYGVYKGKFFVIVRVSMDMDFGDTYDIIFTNNIDLFFEKYLKGKPKPLPKPLCIKPGLYEIGYSMFGPVFQTVRMGNTIKPILNNDLYEQLDNEIHSFMRKEEVYDDMDLEYKRGILLYGPPGNGKTSFIKHFLKDRKNFISIIVSIHDDRDLGTVADILEMPNYDKYLKVIVIEDIDGMRNDIRSELLNFLDGMKRMRKVLFIATTNYPDKIDHALKKRPSRFDAVIKIDLPNPTSRAKLLKYYFKDLKGREMADAVKKSKGFSGAYFKEIYLLARLNDFTSIESINRMQQRFRVFGNGD